jgi:hypothetical protein
MAGGTNALAIIGKTDRREIEMASVRFFNADPPQKHVCCIHDHGELHARRQNSNSANGILPLPGGLPMPANALNRIDCQIFEPTREQKSLGPINAIDESFHAQHQASGAEILPVAQEFSHSLDHKQR